MADRRSSQTRRVSMGRPHEAVKPGLDGHGRPHDQCREREMESDGRSRLLMGVPEQGHDSVDVVGEPACALDAEKAPPSRALRRERGAAE